MQLLPPTLILALLDISPSIAAAYRSLAIERPMWKSSLPVALILPKSYGFNEETLSL